MKKLEAGGQTKRLLKEPQRTRKEKLQPFVNNG